MIPLRVGGGDPPPAPRFGFHHGTQRAVAPAITFARIRPMMAAFGITRLADVTGLDRIGIPVFQAIRPLARSLSVSQGKGMTRMAARVGALMESIELHHAETVLPDRRGAGSPADIALCAALGAAGPDAVRDWCEASDLLSGRALSVPHALVSMDCVAAAGEDWGASSNGLASGNHRAEAMVAALCEVIERDAHARWLGQPPSARRATQIDAATIDDRLALGLMRRIAAAGIGLRLWDMSDAAGVAVIGCALFELSARVTLPPAFGVGAHGIAAVALIRAIAEAAQTRVTLIAGSREDIGMADYADPAGARLRLLLETGVGTGGQRNWRRVPDRAAEGIERHGDWLLGRCVAAGARAVALVELTRPEWGVAVVKLVVPGLAGPVHPEID